MLLVAAAITISRRPDVILNAQFWAEDGAVWYRDAHALGWLRAVLLPQDGYYQTASRLTAALAQPLPLAAAPYLFNFVALFWQVLPAAYLVSPRFAALIPSTPARILLAFVYLALPNRAEVHVNITNAQSHLALLALMIVLCPPGRNRWAGIADVLIVTLAGFSTIMSLLLVPVAGLLWVRHRTSRAALMLLLVGVTGAMQLVGLASGPDTRAHDPLGASVEQFFRIIAGQVVLTPLFGARGYEWILAGPLPWAPPLAAAVGTIVLLYAAAWGTTELRLFLLFTSCILTVALLGGQARSVGDGVWAVLAVPEAAARYFFFPSLAFVVSLFWWADRRRPPLARLTAGAMLAAMLLVGIPLDWRLEPLSDLRFAEYAQVYEQAAAGTRVVIPLNPAGWSMELVKR